jgi:hypothetical protein
MTLQNTERNARIWLPRLMIDVILSCRRRSKALTLPRWVLLPKESQLLSQTQNIASQLNRKYVNHTQQVKDWLEPVPY